VLPPGWRDDVLRQEARWDLLLLGAAATWQMAVRERGAGADADPDKVRLRAECTAASGGEQSLVQVPVTMGDDAAEALMPEPNVY
jgi:hypothetical protein